MKKLTVGLCSFLLLLSIAAAQPLSPIEPPEEVEIGIQVSPSTILLNWKAKGDVKVTVHADVRFSLFDTQDIDVWLDGVKATYLKADARGDLVAKFDFEEVAEQVDPGIATLSLRAISRTGTVYTGTDEVRVVD